MPPPTAAAIEAAADLVAAQYSTVQYSTVQWMWDTTIPEGEELLVRLVANPRPPGRHSQEVSLAL